MLQIRLHLQAKFKILLCHACTMPSIYHAYSNLGCIWSPPYLLNFRKFSTQDILVPHPPLIKSLKIFQPDIFKSRQQQKTLPILLQKFLVTDYLLFEFSKSLHCSF